MSDEAGLVPYDDIVWVCAQLCELLDYENEALADHDSSTVRELAENKAALAHIYEQAVRPMAEDPHLVETLAPEQKEELTALGNRLKELVEENARLLKAEMDVYQMLMDAVVEAVKTTKVTAATYSRGGLLDGHSPSDTTSIGINQTL